ELKSRGIDTPVVVGGIIPQTDYAALKDFGVAAVFGPESPLNAVVETVKALAEGTSLPETGDRRPASQGIPATRLDHAAIAVKDMDGALSVLSQILGQPVAYREHVAAQKVE